MFTNAFELPNSCFSDRYNVGFITDKYDTYGTFNITCMKLSYYTLPAIYIPVDEVLRVIGDAPDSYKVSNFVDGRGQVCRLINHFIP